MNKKAQLAMIDLMVAMGISLIMIAAIVISWNNIMNEINAKKGLDDMHIKLLQVSDVLISSYGTPSSWEKDVNNIESLGLATSDRILNTAKLTAASSLSTSIITSLLQLQSYKLIVDVKELDDTPLYQIRSTADSPSETVTLIVLNRLAMLENEVVKVKFTFWK
ncbi:MAG TPA: hypothetical protein VJJ23_06320 [Candidatus Nanoarchaeia archaeon]|nr:hypothetical protein [Candidatus Nanoarchaeia archaeon]